MGTSLREAIDRAGGGVEDGQRVAAVLVGVSNAVLTEAQLDTELSYEAMTAAGSGLGSAGFIVVGERYAADQRRRRSVAVPGGRVVRSVHAVQAGRRGDRPHCWPEWLVAKPEPLIWPP